MVGSISLQLLWIIAAQMLEVPIRLQEPHGTWSHYKTKINVLYLNLCPVYQSGTWYVTKLLWNTEISMTTGKHLCTQLHQNTL